MSESHQKLTVAQTARPLRLGLLVDPDDMRSVRRAIQCNTAQWGGVFNSLIPVYRRRPSWWKPRIVNPSKLPSARQIAEAALDSCDPDYVVECRDNAPLPAVGERFERLERSHLLSGSASGRCEPPRAGISSALVYGNLHRDLFRFLRTAGPEAVIPQAKAPHRDMASACFGLFPSERGSGSLASRYETALEATGITVSPETLLSLHGYSSKSEARLLWPLEVGSEGLRVYGPGWRRGEQAFFLLDPESPIDLIDFWNVRASGRPAIPVPLDWAEEVAAIWTELWRSRGSNEPADITVVGGRRVAGEALIAFRTAMAETGGSVLLDPGMTPWGSPFEQPLGKPQLVAAERREQVRLESGRLSFSLIAPEILQGNKLYSTGAWASVVRLSYGGGELAEAFPPELGMVGDLFNAWEPVKVWAREEGLVSIIGDETRADWKPPSGIDVFSSYASKHGFEPRLSEPGRVSREIVRRLGGLIAVGMVRHPALVELFEKAVRRDSRSARRPEMWKAVMRARGSERRANGLLRALLERRVIDAGVLVKCPTCAKSNWYGPDDLGFELNCERCLNDFPFPGHDPPHRDDWAYRPRGGFASPEYAMGAYSVLLSLRLLSGMGERISWAPSMTLNSSTEVDFALWQERSRIYSGEPSEWTLLLGECKSHREFKRADIQRMEQLRTAFPEAILVFASLRTELSAEEVDGLLKLARPSDPGRTRPRPDVVILTSTELFADTLPGAWKDAGGRAAKLAPEQLFGHRPEIETLADVTQQIHLRTEPFDAWRNGVGR